MNADVNFSSKVIGSWKLGVELYDEYDSKPPLGGDSVNDYHVATTLNDEF